MLGRATVLLRQRDARELTFSMECLKLVALTSLHRLRSFNAFGA